MTNNQIAVLRELISGMDKKHLVEAYMEQQKDLALAREQNVAYRGVIADLRGRYEGHIYRMPKADGKKTI